MLNRLIILPTITQFSDRHPHIVAALLGLWVVVGCALTGS